MIATTITGNQTKESSMANRKLQAAESTLRSILKKFKIAAAAIGVAHEKDGDDVLIVSLKQKVFADKAKVQQIPPTVKGYKVETKLVVDVDFL